METETIDKLFLELSQFTRAQTKREIELFAAYDAVARNADKYGLALRMIAEGCADPAGFAGRMLSVEDKRPNWSFDPRDAFEVWADADHRDTAALEFEERNPDNFQYYAEDSTNDAYVGWYYATAGQGSGRNRADAHKKDSP